MGVIYRYSLPVIGIVIPLPPFWSAQGIHEDIVLRSHRAVKILQPEGFLAFKKTRQVIASSVKMLRITGGCLPASFMAGLSVSIENLIQSVFIGQLPMECSRLHTPHDPLQIPCKGLPVLWTIQRHVMHPVSCIFESPCKEPHRTKEGHDLLNVMNRIICLCANFHQHIQPMWRRTFIKPRMTKVQLIAAN